MKKLSPALFIGMTMMIALLMITTSILNLGLTEEAIRQSLRETARLSLALFLTTFVAGPLHQLMNNTVSKWLVVHRRYLGISFGLSHMIHLCLIVYLIYQYGNSDLSNIAPIENFITGGLAYLFIIAMLATSNNQSIKRLGFSRWKRLHTYGMYLLFVVFFSSFAGLVEKNVGFYLPIVLLMLLAALVRLAARMTNTNKVRTA